MTADVEMLPCPWCGEKLASVSVSEGNTSRWRKVDGCCADGPEVRHNTMAEDQEAAEVESRAAAIAAWNTRANVAHATAAKDADIEALRAEVATWEGLHASEVQVRQRWQAHAERLEEALQELRDLMLGQVKWKPCDCGCPQQRTPDGPHSVTWLRAAQQVDIAIGKARGVAE